MRKTYLQRCNAYCKNAYISVIATAVLCIVAFVAVCILRPWSAYDLCILVPPLLVFLFNFPIFTLHFKSRSDIQSDNTEHKTVLIHGIQVYKKHTAYGRGGMERLPKYVMTTAEGERYYFCPAKHVYDHEIKAEAEIVFCKNTQMLVSCIIDGKERI